MSKFNRDNKARDVLSFRHTDIANIPSNVRGVYAYWCRAHGRCIYLGKAEKQSIRDRLMQEWRDPKNEKLKLWMQVFGKELDICYLHVRGSNIDRMERRLIKHFHPETNTIHNRR